MNEELLVDFLKYLLTIWKKYQNTFFNNQILSLYLKYLFQKSNLKYFLIFEIL